MNDDLAPASESQSCVCPEGWQCVPVQPTREMIDCALYAEQPNVPFGGSNNANRMRRRIARIYRQMLATAEKA